MIVPPSPGVLCALGDATTSLRDESARTVLRRFADLDGAELIDLLGELAGTAGASLTEQGLDDSEQTVGYQVDVRYHGQGFEIPIEVDPAWLEDPDTALTRLAEGFDAEHERLFSFLLTVDHELVNARATVTGPRPEVASIPLGDGDGSVEPDSTHEIYVSGGMVTAGIYDRARLRAGDVVVGPAVITEMDSTTLVLPDHEATVHPSGSLLINPTSTDTDTEA